MNRLLISLFGPLTITVGGSPSNTLGRQLLKDLSTDKVRALLAYLALHPECDHPRRHLAALLWPEASDKQARQSLRDALYRLRQSLDRLGAHLEPPLRISEQLLVVSHQTVQFQASSTYLKTVVDVACFRAHLAAVEEHPHVTLAECEQCLAALEEATLFYQGELLADFGLVNAPDFEEWLLLQREMLHQQALLAFGRLADIYAERGSYEKASSYATKLLSLDPYRETSQRLVMRLLALSGMPDQALAQFASCRQLLMEEFGAEPDAETVALAEQIRRGELPPPNLPQSGGRTVSSFSKPLPSPPQPSPSWGGVSRPRHDWREMPVGSSFFGRTEEVAQLTEWLVTDRCRLVSILAIGGMGKTSLAAEVVPTIAEQFDLVIWRSLLNAPPLVELLSTILPTLSNQQLDVLPHGDGPQLQLLFDYLHERRVLLVLDNIETIVQMDAAGQYRAGYESYGQLLHGVVTQQHRGQLLFTSREQPAGIRRLERDSAQVRTLWLSGLDEAAGHRLLASRGLSGSAVDEAALTQRYSGNPLAIKLVADTVQELFFGDIKEFLSGNSLIFDGVRHILDQQFARLTALEQEILYWLTIKRTPVDVPTLREIMLSLPAGRTLLEALSSLQRRSLIERQASGFALQNVISEYLTDRFIERATQELTDGALELLHRHAPVLVQSEEHVRQSQIRLILQPVARQISTNLTRNGLATHLQQILDRMRLDGEAQDSYAAGSILNMLLHLEQPLDDLDFSYHSIRQADLRNRTVTNVNFACAHFADSIFTQTFSRIEAVAISPDGTTLAGSGDGGEIRLYRLPAGQLLDSLAAHTHSVTTLAFSPDGTTLASASEDGTTRLWALSTGCVLHVLESQIMPRAVAFSPDGLWIACVGLSPLVYIWDTQSGSLLWTLDVQTRRAEDVTFDRTGRLMAIGDVEGRIHLWQADAGTPRPWKILYTPASRSVFSLLFNQAGTHLFSGTENGNIDIWDVARGESRDALIGHTDEVLTLAFSTDERVLFSGSRDFTIRAWQTVNGQTLSVQRGYNYVWTLALTPDAQLLVAGDEDGAIRLWNVAIPEQSTLQETIYGYRCSIYNVCWSANGRWLATRDVHSEVCLWDMKSTVPRFDSVSDEQAFPASMSIAFSPDSHLLAMTNESALQLWNVKSLERVGTLDVITPPHNVAFSADGSLLATGHDEGIARLWDVSALTRNVTCHEAPNLSSNPVSKVKLVRQLQGHSSAVGVTFAPDSELFITWDTHSYSIAPVCLWNSTTGQQIAEVPFEEGRNFAIVDPKGRYLAVPDSDFNILLLNLLDSVQLHPTRKLTGHTHHVSSAAFSPDGSILVSGSLDHSIRLWDVASGKQISVLGHHPQYVTGVAFSPDGESVASIGKEGTLRIWHVASGECCHILHAPGPYQGMNITGATGITEAQRDALKALGAVEA